MSISLDEWAVLGSMARGGSFTCSEVSAILAPEDFTDATLGRVFSAMLEIAGNNKNIDRTQLTAAITPEIPQGSPILASEIVSRIFDAVVNDSNARWYAYRVKDQSTMLQARGILEAAAQQGREWDGTAADFVEDVQRQVFAIDAARPETQATDVYTLVPEWQRELWEDYDSPENARAIDPGLPTFRRFLGGGFQGGRVYVIAARPGRGKTTLSIQMAVAAAKVQTSAYPQGVFAHIFSLEMTKKELLNKMAFSASAINFDHYQERKLAPNQRKVINSTAAWLRTLPLHIHDDRNITLPRLLSICRRHRFAGTLDLIVIDYLQLLESGKSGKQSPENRNQEVTQISRTLQKLAGELDVPIILISQLNRTIEKRGDGTPMLSDLRESGSIEQDAYTVAFLYEDREEKEFDPDAVPMPVPGDYAVGENFLLDIKKNRGGQEGKIPLLFWKEIGKLGETFRGQF